MSQPRPSPETQDRRPSNRPPAWPPARLAPQELRQIFTPSGYLAVNELGQQLGNTLAQGGVTRSQVRNILNSFQAIAETWDAIGPGERGRQIARLKPNLVYLAARETSRDRRQLLQDLAQTLGVGVDAVLEGEPTAEAMKERYTALVDLVEAITAYHRANAGSE